jgi:LysM repeat protein
LNLIDLKAICTIERPTIEIQCKRSMVQSKIQDPLRSNKWLRGPAPECRQVEMDRMRIFYVILFVLAPLSTVPAQDKADSAKVEGDKLDAAKTDASLLRAQVTELQKLKEEITAQADKIDKLTQEVAALTEALKPKAAPPVARAEPASTATPPPATPEPATAGVDKPVADSANAKTHVVAKGETLTQISKQYGVSVEDIQELNKIGDAKKLQAGQTIKIPISAQASPSPTP